MNYQDALEFIGQVRAGVSWKHFCIHAVRSSDAFIDILNDTEESKKFLSSKGITREYVAGQITMILLRLHFNRENDHCLTLALSGSASEAQIHKRWKELMLLYHPDRNSDEQAAACAARINEAYSILKNPEKRMEYETKKQSLTEAFHLVRRNNALHTPPPREFIITSSKMRTTLSKLIIPFCAVLAAVTLLVIFLENRQQRYVHHTAADDKADGQQQTQSEDTRPEPASAAPDGEAGKTMATDAEPLDIRGERPAPKKEKPHSFPAGGGTDAPAARTEVPRKEQKFIPRVVPAPERNQDTPPGRTVKTHAERRGATEKADGKTDSRKNAETRDVNDREAFAGRPAERPRETSAETIARPQPIPQTQTPAKAEPEDIDKSVDQFIGRYIRAYEEGDIERFMSFFSRSAVENGRMNFDDIRRAYKKNFDNGRHRYSLRNVQFRKNGDNVILAASYTINKSLDNGGEALVRGDIRWTLAREGGSLKILKVDYERR
jgi:curved DNA-binding protein CbpA/ketosteroid isomerase-like protein